MVNNIEHFIYNQFKPFVKTQAIKRLLFVMVIGVVVSLVGNNIVPWLLITSFLFLITAIVFLIIIVRHSAKDISRFICDGVTFLHLSILMTLLSYRLISLNDRDNLLLLALLLIALVIIISLLVWITMKKIKRGVFNYDKPNTVNLIPPLVFGSGGMIVARWLLINQSQDTIILVIALIVLLLSYVFALGSINLLKALLLRRVNRL